MNYSSTIDQQKQLNAAVFSETMAICAMGNYMSPSGKQIQLEQTTMHQGAEMVNQAFSVADVPTLDEDTQLRVEQADCLQVAEQLVREGYRPAMLNMASGGHPGGNVVHGSRAQEETICRRSNLACSIFSFSYHVAADWQLPHKPGNNYPMNANYGGVYSPAVTVFRQDGRHGYTLMEQPFQVDVISVAAINGNRFHEHFLPNGDFGPSGIQMTLEKLRTIYRLALKHGNDSLVLSAFGCGAFQNPPHQMARLMREVLEEDEFRNKFRLVTVAILEDHNSQGRNYNAFEQNFLQDQRS